MVSKIEPIPDNMTIEEASEFWNTHSIADYPSQIVEIEYSSEERITLIAIGNELITQLRKQAKKDGISIETLVNLWIKEKLSV